MKFEDRLEIFYPKNRQEWRKWLSIHHQTSLGVWLFYYKVKTGKPSIRYPEAVQEALCFGWIDSKVKTINEECYQQIFTPRKPTSVWSRLNKQYIAELTTQNLMTEAGLAAVEIAQKNGSWTALDAVEALIIPEDLQQALDANETAKNNFQGFSKSAKKNILFWIQTAKRPETRSQRIEKTIAAAEQNQNPRSRR